MKDGRPSRLWDIRVECSGLAAPVSAHAARAFGRRVAWLLNAEELSLGAYHTLHLRLSGDAVPGSITFSDGGEWWFRNVEIGIAAGETGLKAVETAIASVLKNLKPEAHAMIDTACSTAAAHGPALRFLVRRHAFKVATLEVATTIATWPEEDLLVAAVIDAATGQRVDLPPFATGMYFQAFKDAKSIRLSDIAITRGPGGRITADWSASSGLPLPTAIGRRCPDGPISGLVHG